MCIAAVAVCANSENANRRRGTVRNDVIYRDSRVVRPPKNHSRGTQQTDEHCIRELFIKKHNMRIFLNIFFFLLSFNKLTRRPNRYPIKYMI